MTDSSHAAQLRALISSGRGRRLSPRAAAIAKMGILDCIGCIVGGSATRTAEIAREFARSQANGSGVSVLGTGIRLPAPLAALANGVAGHALDYDDMSSTIVGHPSVVLVPALMAIGEAQRVSGAQLLAAYVTGFEVDGYFGRQMVPRHYQIGWHSTSTIGVLAAAVAASELLGSEPALAAQALGIAASGAAGLRANFGTMTKSLHAGQAAETGLRAALLARAGFTSSSDAFDIPEGFFNVYATNPTPVPPRAGGALEIETTGIGIKPYPCCGAGVSVVDTALDLRRANPFSPEGIESLDIVVSDMARSIMPFHEAVNDMQAKYSLAYCAAVALIDGRGGLAQFSDERLRRDDVCGLVRRTTVKSDPSMASGAGLFGVRIKVRHRDGQEYVGETVMPRGHPDRPLSTAELEEKFLECAVPVLGDAKAQAAVAMLLDLEHVPEVGELARALSS